MNNPTPAQARSPQPYRPDIDGLRAVAVLAVLVGHAKESLLPGGFLGVDVFFVISGYVITQSLLGRSHPSFGQFIGAFFLRRIKRLMPALLVTFVVTALILVWIDREPKTSLITGAMSLIGLSNLALYEQAADYFSASIRYNAFTHTWSLGVEEQFYLLFPLLFWFAYARRAAAKSGRLMLWVVILSAASVLGYVILQAPSPMLAYYMMPFRFWELGAGVAAAIWVHRHGGRLGFAPVFGTLGIVALLAVFLVSGQGLMGGYILSVLLTVALLIGGAGPSQSSRLLDNQLAIYIGRISYSLYLWHWPFLTFGLLRPDSFIAHTPVAVLCAFVAAILSYHFVEQPVRRLPTPRPRGIHFGIAASAVCAAVLIVGGANELRKAATEEIAVNPYPPHFLPLPVSGGDHNPTCVVDDRTRLLTPQTFGQCTFVPEGARESRTLWVLGDSHAGHLQGGLVRLHEDHGFGLHLVETPGVAFPITRQDGFASRDKLMAEARKQWQPGDVVVLSRLYFQRAETLVLMEDLPLWMARVDALAQELRAEGLDLVLIGPPPMFGFEDLRACAPDRRLDCGIERAELAPAIDRVHDMLRGVTSAHPNVTLFDSFNALCPPSTPVCTPARDGVFWYRDRDHLNAEGSAALVPALLKTLDALR